MADFDALLPVRTTAGNFTTEVANATGTTINPVEEFAQGSTTSGQSGSLVQGAVTTAAPTYTTGTTNPLSLDTSGNLRVTFAASSETNVNLNQVGGSAISLGNTTMSASLPVTIASNQTAFPVTLASTTITGTVAVTQSGTWNLTNISGTISLPTGASTSALQTTGNTSLSTIATALTLAQASTTSGQTGNLILAAATTAAPTYTTGTSNPLSTDLAGNLRVTLSASAAEQNVNLNQVGGSAIALGQTTMAASLPVTFASNQSTLPVSLTSTTITGTVAVTQSTSPWVVSGTVTSNIGTTNGLALDTSVNGILVAQGSTTSGEKGPLIQGAVTTAAPSYTTAQTSPISLTTAGAVRVDGSATTQPVSGTVTANAGTGSFTVAQATAANLNATVVVSGTPSMNLTQVGGSSVALGQTTMASSIPVVIASNQSPINVSFGGITQTYTYAANTAVASGSSATQTVAGPINLDAVHVTASGEVKVVISTGVTGSETVKWVGFTSAAAKNFDWVLEDTLVIPSGSDVKVVITNRDTAAMDLYSTVVNH